VFSQETIVDVCVVLLLAYIMKITISNGFFEYSNMGFFLFVFY